MYLKLIILGIIQGLTEFFPVSSSGHLVMLQEIFGLEEMFLFDIFMHLASFLAIVLVFRKNIIQLKIKSIFNLFLAMVPTVIIYFIFKRTIGDLFETIKWLWLFFALSGFIIYFTKFTQQKDKALCAKDAIFIGFLQGCALLPGLSRSGLTVSGALYRKIEQTKAIEFSFLLGALAILAATLLKVPNLIKNDFVFSAPIACGFAASFITSLVSLKIIIKIIKASKFYRFAYYCWFISIVSLLVKFFS